MSSIRRSITGVVLASVLAFGAVMAPAQAQAQDNSLYCAFLENAIAFQEGKQNPPQALLEKLYALYETYCTAE
jgi:hypothetical protein